MQLTRENGNRLADAIRIWRLRSGSYPAVAAVRFGGAFQSPLTPWPTNPYSGKPMSAGSGPGDYRYAFDRRGFTLTWSIAHAGSRVFLRAPPVSVLAAILSSPLNLSVPTSFDEPTLRRGPRPRSAA